VSSEVVCSLLLTSAMTYDPRITPARPELAALHLEGKVEAARFVVGTEREVVAAQAPMRREPSPDSAYDTEALRGERVTVYEENEEGWSWGQLRADGYVGWLPSGALRPPGPAPTHRVAALRSLVFPGRSIKTPPIDALSFGCSVAVTAHEGNWMALASGGYMSARQLAAVETRESDFVAVAERFIGVPYLWGGKTSLGLDCSGLVQVALASCGMECPRDSDMQERALGVALAGDLAGLRRGDLLFWNGHVAIVRDAGTLLHANGFHMAVAIEPIAEAISRIRATGSEITGIKRLFSLSRLAG
jgi:cell wall-associated NlpC family hydrolase